MAPDRFTSLRGWMRGWTRFGLASALIALAAVVCCAPCASSAGAAEPQFRIAPADEAWRAALPRDADAATKAYLDRLPADVVARANAYAEGGYWLQLWNFLALLVVCAVVLGGGRSARVRDFTQRIGRKAFVRDALYGAYFAIASFVLGLPLVIYQGFVREHQYGLSTQGFGTWFFERLVELGVNVIVSSLAVGILYAAIRRAGERWWLWGTGVAVALFSALLLVGPVWIDPLFNTYKTVENGEIRSAVLAMAKADGVPADEVYEFDASRQSTRVSANVSGIFGTASVRLNDNLLRRSSLPEIRAVMGHELGHYVMNHVYKLIMELTLFIAAAFLFAQWAMRRLLARHGQRLALAGVADVASMPLLTAVFAAFFFVGTPVTNTVIRVQEIEADRFGLNLAREPLGMAEVLLKLTEYRKPSPGPIEEFVFFDHPSTRFRIHDAMRWREAMAP